MAADCDILKDLLLGLHLLEIVSGTQVHLLAQHRLKVSHHGQLALVQLVQGLVLLGFCEFEGGREKGS
jgi:hypothetical protein